MVENGGRDGSPIRERLQGKRVLLTGVTGFLGTAIFERLLHDFPSTHVVVLARGRYGTAARSRVEEVVAGNAFARFREREGSEGVKRTLAERVTVVEGDLASD